MMQFEDTLKHVPSRSGMRSVPPRGSGWVFDRIQAVSRLNVKYPPSKAPYRPPTRYREVVLTSCHCNEWDGQPSIMVMLNSSSDNVDKRVHAKSQRSKPQNQNSLASILVPLRLLRLCTHCKRAPRSNGNERGK